MQPGDGKNDHSSNLFSISTFLEIQDTINNRCNVCRVDTKSGHLPYKIGVIDHLKQSKKLCILSRWVLLDLIWQRLDRRESQVCNLDETKQSFVSLNLTDIVCPESWLLLLTSSDSLYVSQNYLTSIQSVIKITKEFQSIMFMDLTFSKSIKIEIVLALNVNHLSSVQRTKHKNLLIEDFKNPLNLFIKS